jgi:hypothetical protein
VCRVRPRLVGSRSQHRAHALRAVRLTVWAKSLGVIGELISLIWAKSSGSAQLESWLLTTCDPQTIRSRVALIHA